MIHLQALFRLEWSQSAKFAFNLPLIRALPPQCLLILQHVPKNAVPYHFAIVERDLCI